MKLSPILIFTLVLVGMVLWLLGWKVSEKKHLSEKLHELQKPSTEFAVSKPHPRTPAEKSSEESSTISVVEEEALREINTTGTIEKPSVVGLRGLHRKNASIDSTRTRILRKLRAQ